MLHCDISPGNILITGKSERGRRGVLIDYENAILWEDHEAFPDEPVAVRLFFSFVSLFLTRAVRELDRSCPRRCWTKNICSMTMMPFYLRYNRRCRRGNINPSMIQCMIWKVFFWILVWICLSRDGPARRQSELLCNNQDPRHKSLRTTFTRIFEADDHLLALMKQEMFMSPRRFMTSVLQNVSTYCKPLEDLLRQFYLALRSAHKSQL